MFIKYVALFELKIFIDTGFFNPVCLGLPTNLLETELSHSIEFFGSMFNFLKLSGIVSKLKFQMLGFKHLISCLIKVKLVLTNQN